MASKKAFSICFLFLLVGGIFANIMPQAPFYIPNVQGATLPTEGDAWTENNEAVFDWIFHTSYATNNVMAWITSDVKAGTYALKITHGQANTGLNFRLLLNTTYDFTPYDGLYFWWKSSSTDTSYTLRLEMNSVDTNYDATNKMDMELTTNPAVTNGTWQQYFAPWQQFKREGTANPAAIRQIYFIMTGLPSASGSTFIIDGMRVGDFEVSSVSGTVAQQSVMANAWHNFKEAQYDVTYGGQTYSNLYAFQTTTTNVWHDEGIEDEIIGHSLYALSWAYDVTGFTFYLEEANNLANWLLNYQILTPASNKFKGMFLADFSDTLDTFGQSFSGSDTPWAWAGLNYLYHLTGNATYKTASDLTREAMSGINWNTTYSNTDNGGNNNTGVETYSTGYAPMRDGSALVGFSTYYKFVSQNATVLNRMQSLINTMIQDTGSASWNRTATAISSAYEDASYFLTGLYWAYSATLDSTYQGYFLNGTKAFLAKMIQQPDADGSGNGDIGRPLQWQFQTANYRDNWGLANSLHFFYLANQIEPADYWLNALERTFWIHLANTQDDDGSWNRDIAGYTTESYFGVALWAHMAYQLYRSAKALTTPYVVGSSATISNVASDVDSFSFRLTDNTTSTTSVYAGVLQKPRRIDGLSSTGSWTYDDSTKIITIVTAHSSVVDVTIWWSGEAQGKYTLTISVLSNFYPIQGAIVQINGQNQTTNLFGLTEWVMPYGTYHIFIFFGSQNQTQRILLNQDMTRSFNFEPVAIHSNYSFIAIPLFVLAVGFLFFFLFKRRR